MRPTKPTVVAVKIGQPTVPEEVMAVIDLIAAAIGRIEQCFVEIGEKEAGQRVAKMMV